MSVSRHLIPYGEPIMVGPFCIQEERKRTNGNSWFRLTGKAITVVLSPDDVFNLADTMDAVADQIETEGCNEHG